MSQTETDPLEELDREEETDASAGDSEADSLVCPDCGETLSSKMLLGAHRFHKHGIRGSSGKAKKRRGESSGRGPGRPRTTAAAGDDGETARQKRRRRAVKETLVELTSFTDELRGRGLAPAEDLADVIRRDADKIANSVAWIAERFNPLGRMIDLGFGHGGLVTVGRGFMGVGTWLLRSWRGMLQERAAGGELTAEEIAEQMAREYGPADRAYVS